MKYPAFSTPEDAVKHYKLKERAGYDLAPLQLEDLKRAACWDRVKWFYDVGVGKTVCSTVHAWMGGHQVHLVLVPPILITQWGKWLRRVDPNCQVLEYRGTPKQRKELKLVGPKWIIMSYAIFRDEFDRIFKELGRLHPHLIIDEAHHAKNSHSLLFRRINTLATGGTIQLLTGTPTSKPLDAYAYIKLTTPTRYRSLGQFENLHVESRDFFGNIQAYKDLEMVKMALMDCACKRTKEEMFPGIVKARYQVMDYELDAKHLRLYKDLAEEQLLLLSNGEKIDATQASTLYHALQQIVVNLDHFSGDDDARSAAYDLIDQTIDETQCMDPARSKLIIWTYYKRTSASILHYLEDFGAVGAYSGANSVKSVDKFLNDPKCRILVAQPTSAGFGLEPQHVCWENLFIEHSTVPLHFAQSVGRTDRKGQMHMPTMRVAVAQNTIQVPLHSRLLHNGDLVKQTEGNIASIRDAIYGKN
jgi:hypothetical protein